VHRNTNDSLQTNIKKGDEILAINTYSAKQIIDVLKYYHTVDGHSFDFNFNLINKYFPLLYAHCIEQSPLFAIQYRNSAAQVQTETLNAMIEKELKQPVKNATPLIAGHDEYFSVKNDSIGILTISSFHAVRKHFYKTVFAYLTRHKINNLVIDVRENLGGSRFNADELIAYLTKEKCKYEMIRPKHNLQAYCKGVNKLNFYLSYLFYDIGMLFESKTTQEGAVFTTNIAPKKNRYTGKTYVLANGYTGSSASQVASYIKHHANAKIIGQQTAGGELSNNGGSFSDIVLPNSRLAISVATYLMRYDIKSDNPNGIVPDYPIIYDINSYKTRDLELEKVFDLIANVPKTHF
jgi:C-terminal processing protease CtpA/Prc